MIIASDDVRSRGLAEMIVAPARIADGDERADDERGGGVAGEEDPRDVQRVERDRGDAQPRQEEREQQPVLDRALGRDAARELERLVGTDVAVTRGDVVARRRPSRRPVAAASSSTVVVSVISSIPFP